MQYRGMNGEPSTIILPTRLENLLACFKSGRFLRHSIGTLDNLLAGVFRDDVNPALSRFAALRNYGDFHGHCNAVRSCKILHYDGRELKIGSSDNAQIARLTI